MLVATFGKRLRYWRNKRGLSLRRLQQLSEVTSYTISGYEHGRRSPNLYSIERLLDALNVSITDFYSEEINHG